MARSTIVRSNHQNRAFYGLGILCLMLLMHKACAKEFRVGGSKGWSVPTDNSSQSYNQWAESNRFQIGDSLLFVYPTNQDSVLHVSNDAYVNCNTDSHIEKFTDGHTSFTLNQSGSYYFISGNKTNCLKMEKLLVIVLADRSNHSSTTNQTTTVSPPPSGSMGMTPSPAPSGSMGMTPSPAPSAEEAPSPPSGTVEINPASAPAPSAESHPPNAASSNFMSSIGSIEAFVGSLSLLLVLI